MYSFWQTVTGTTSASKAKAASKKATAKKTTKKAVAKKTSAKASPSKPAAKTPRKSVQCFFILLVNSDAYAVLCSPPSDLKMLQLS